MDPLSSLAGFINQYFTNPLAYPDKYAPYNVVNTLTFAAIGLIAIYFIYRWLAGLKVRIDPSFAWAVVPFILLGSTLHVLEDSGILPRTMPVGGYTAYPFVTPVLYVLVFLLFAASLSSSLILAPRSRHSLHSLLSFHGWALLILSILPLISHLGRPLALAEILALSSLGILAYALLVRVKKIPFDPLSCLAVWSQSFDGAATFIGVWQYGYFEQHVVGNAVFSFFGTPFAFFLLKLCFGLLVVHVAREELRSEKDASLRTYLLLLISLFGLAPGMRDTLRLLAGV